MNKTFTVSFYDPSNDQVTEKDVIFKTERWTMSKSKELEMLKINVIAQRQELLNIKSAFKTGATKEDLAQEMMENTKDLGGAITIGMELQNKTNDLLVSTYFMLKPKELESILPGDFAKLLNHCNKFGVHTNKQIKKNKKN